MIRQMTMEDVPEVAELEKMIFTDPWSENVYRQTLGIKDTCYLITVIDDTIVAVAGVRNIVGDGEITNVMVHPDYRRKGFARAMLEELLIKGKEIGVIDFTLEVRASNKSAINLYEELGFKTEGVRPGFYQHPDEDALIMWKRS